MPSLKQTRNIGADAGTTTYVGDFSPVLGGYYTNGTLYDKSTRGFWWASTAYNDILRYRLRYDGSGLYTGNLYYVSRNVGIYIRCVSEEKDVSDLTYMQDMTPSVADGPKGWTLPSNILYTTS